MELDDSNFHPLAFSSQVPRKYRGPDDHQQKTSQISVHQTSYIDRWYRSRQIIDKSLLQIYQHYHPDDTMSNELAKTLVAIIPGKVYKS